MRRPLLRQGIKAFIAALVPGEAFAVRQWLNVGGTA